MISSKLNIRENRSSLKYSRKEIFLRILWGLCTPIFRYSPRPLFHWRCFLLRLFGAKIGSQVHIYNTAKIYMPWNLSIADWSSIGEDVLIYNLGTLSIGSQTTISHRAHICGGTHDYSSSTLPLIKSEITIGNQCWICTESFIGPSVTIEDGAITGARSVVIKDVQPWTVVAGNPAKHIKVRHVKK